MTASTPRSSRQESLVDRRVLFLCGLAVLIAAAAAGVAQLLTALIGLITNIAFYGRWSAAFTSPAGNHLGYGVVLVPVVGGVIVGFMARYGSRAIRGHGIPEAMESVLANQSHIPARLVLLKPVSAAIAIGTGGPFGAEGPIIATGGALGSLVGQFLHTTADERKTLLAAGAAAGMSAIFGTPVAAVLLAVELLLFEFSARTLIPVALASAVAAGARAALAGPGPVFAIPALAPAGGAALAAYILLGALAGLASVFVTRVVYAVEDGFEHVPVHWMWWPALGGLVVGVIGAFAPLTLGVGYDNITNILAGSITGWVLARLCLFKFVSWAVSLGSGTSGGTLAPLLTIGGALGGVAGAGLSALFPSAGIDPRLAALVGMAALFTGASRAFLASVVFAYEATMQPAGLLPLLAGCAAAHLVSCALMRDSLMTEKIARRGIRVPAEYAADPLQNVLVRDVASATIVALRGDDDVKAARSWLASGAKGSEHQAFPVLDGEGRLLGVVTRRELEKHAAPADAVRDIVRRAPVVVREDDTLREAVDQMSRHDIGRLAVVSAAAPHKVVGFLTRTSVLSAFRRHFEESRAVRRSITFGRTASR